MAEFLHDLNIHGAGQIQFKTTAGSNAGKIDQSGNDLVLSNAVGDIIIGNGSDDVFIGDGTNTVDIRFEQNMAIFADSSSTRTLTLGGANTSVVIESPTINGTLSLSATTMSDNLIFTTTNGHIVFDYEPSGDTGEYTTEVALLKIDKDGTEKTILSRVSQEGALALGADDTVAITAGDTKSVIKANHSFTNENVVFASESGFLAFGFPGNDTSWSNRNVFQFKSDSTTASDNGLYIGDGGQTQFIDLSRNLKNIGTITASSSITLGGNNPTLTLNDSDGRAAAIDVVGNTFRIDDVDNNAAIFTADLSTNPVQTTFAGPLSAGSYSLTAGSLDINGNGDISGNLNITGNITNANWQGDVISVAKGGTGVTANTTWLNANSFANFASSSADWDTITTRGSYRLTGSTNNPFGSSHATGLVITQGSGDYGIQLFSSASTDNGLGIAYRYRGTSWQNWQYLVTKTYGDGRYLKLSGGTMSGDIAMGNNDITGVKFIQANGNVDIRTGSGEYAMHATQDGQTSLYHNGIKKFETSSTGIDVVGEVKGDSLDIDGNADISGTLDTGRITINSNSDNILNLNQTSSDNKWNYINFNNQGTRDWFIGQDSDGNFDLYNDNIDAYAITVSLSDNSIVLNDNVNVAGNLVLNSNSTVVAARKFTARDGNGVMLTADDAASGLSIADNGNATFTGAVTMSGVLDGVTNMFLGEYLYHQGDGDTYLNFQNANEFRIVIGGSEKIHFNTSRIRINDDLHAAADSSYDIGTSSVRFANIYADTLYGDGSNITNVTASNADTVDNLHASSFLRSDGSDTASGKITFAQNAATIALAGTNHTYAEFYKTGTGNARSAYLGFGSSGNNHFNIANEISGGKVIIDTNSGSVEINDNTTIDADLTVTGNFTITGDLNTVSVTDLDVTDKTITVGVGQTAANSGSSGLIIDRSDSTNPSMLWNQTDGRFEFNSGVTVTGQLHTTGSVYAKGALYVVDTDSTNNHVQVRSNGTEGFITVNNGSNWGLIMRGPANDPRIGAYYGGTLKIEGFHSSDGSTGSNAVDFAQFQFGNDHFQMNAATSTFAGNLLVDKAGDNVSHIQLRRDTTADNTIVGDINWLNSNAEGTDDRLAVIRAATQGGNTSNRGGKLSFFTRVGSSSAFRENSINQYGDWTFYRHLTVSTGTGAGTVKLPVGSSSAPSLTFINNTDSGIYTTDGTSVTTTVDGTKRLNVTTAGIDVAGNIIVSGTVDGVDIAALATANTGDQDISGIATNATAIAGKVSKSGDTMTGALTMVDSNVISGSGDVKIYARSTDTGASFIQFQNTSTGSSNSDGLTVGVNSTNAYIWNREASNLYLGTNDTAAVTIDSSQNATFAGTINNTGDVTITNGNVIFSSQYGVRFNDANTRIYTNTDSPEDLIIEADQDLLLTPDGQVSITGNLAVSGTVDGVDIATRDGVLTSTTTTANAALPKAGGTMTGHLILNDSKMLKLGNSGAETSIYSDGTDTYIQQTSGNLYLYQGATNKDIVFYCDKDDTDLEIARFDGSDQGLKFKDGKKIIMGDSGDIQIQSDNSNQLFDFYNLSNVIFRQHFLDGDMTFQSDNGSGGVTTYFKLDGSATEVVFSKDIHSVENIYVGDNKDLYIFHNGNDSYIQHVGTGDLFIRQNVANRDIGFYCDDGSGGETEYFRVDGGDVRTIASKPFRFIDSIATEFGTDLDMQIYHSGGEGTMQNYTGNLRFIQDQNDGDIIFKCDDGSGGTMEYFRLDGGNVNMITSVNNVFVDGKRAGFGDSADLEIYHGSGDSYIQNDTGHLYIQNYGDDKNIELQTDNGSGGAIKYFRANGATGEAILYHYGTEKLATTSTGIIINNSNSITTDSGRLQVNGAFKATGAIADVDIPYVIHTGWGDDTSTTANKIIPLGNSVTEQNVSAADGQHFFVAPYAGSVKKIIMKNVAGSLSSGFTTELKLYINGTQQAVSGELTASSSAITWEPSNFNTFSAADTISLVYQKSATSKYWREVALTMVLIMDSQDI